VLVEATIVLWDSDRKFRLPAEGTRSMIFRFDDGSDGLGGHAISLDDRNFSPGSEHRATIDFWAEEAAQEIVHDAAKFTVWYGGDIGDGRVTALR
jgi:hypothetical protein